MRVTYTWHWTNDVASNPPNPKLRATPLSAAAGQVLQSAPPRDPDPAGARQVTTVRTLLQLGASTSPSVPPPSQPPIPPDHHSPTPRPLRNP